jgi:hypothetical protein
MPTKLTYLKLPDGYRWNLKNKIYIQTGYWSTISENSSQTFIRFAEDLIQAEIDKVDALMASPSTACSPIIYGPANSRLIIPDIWEHRVDLETAFGYNIAISYRQSASPPDPKALDEIVLQPTDPTYLGHLIMTNPLRNALENALSDQWYWE